MNIYDVVTQRRKAFRDMFVALKEYSEPSEREKMAEQHMIDMREMAQAQKLKLESDMMRSTQDFAEEMKLKGMDYDQKIEELGLKNHFQMTRDAMKYNQDLELAELKYDRDIEVANIGAASRQATVKATAKLDREKEARAENKKMVTDYNDYVKGGPKRSIAGADAYNRQLEASKTQADGAKISFESPERSWQLLAAEISTTAGKLGGIGAAYGTSALPGFGTGAGFGGGLALGTIKGLYDFAMHDGKNIAPAFGWVNHGTMGTSHKGIFEYMEEKTRDDFRTSEGFQEYEKRKDYQSFNWQSVYKMHFSDPVMGSESGSTMGTDVLDIAVAMNYEQDMTYMLPRVISAGELEAERANGKTSYSIHMPQAMLLEDGTAAPGAMLQEGGGKLNLYGNFNLITNVLSNSLSQQAIDNVYAYAPDSSYGDQLQRQREIYIGMAESYIEYFDNGFKEFTENGTIANYHQLTTVIENIKSNKHIYKVNNK